MERQRPRQPFAILSTVLPFIRPPLTNSSFQLWFSARVPPFSAGPAPPVRAVIPLRAVSIEWRQFVVRRLGRNNENGNRH